jgi:hypothetical protein
MTIANIIKRDLLVRVFLFAAIFQAFWLTSCEEFRQYLSLQVSETTVKTVFIHDIPSSLEIGQPAKDYIMTESHGNPAVSFCQEAGKIYIKTDGLYLMVLVLMAVDPNDLESYIGGTQKVPEDVTKNGLAFAMTRISDGTARGRILSLSSDINEFGHYWEGGNSGSEYAMATLLITPDARFILQADFFLGNFSPEFTPPDDIKITYAGYSGTLPEYDLNFGELEISIKDQKLVLEWDKDTQQLPDKDRINAFKGDGLKPDAAGNPNLPWTMLSDNFVEDVMDRFS